MATKTARLREMLDRLRSEPAARGFDEVYGRLSRVLNEVEDDLSGLPYDPCAAPPNGRLYPPLWDYVFPLNGRIRDARSAFHLTRFGDNGSIQIVDLRVRRSVFDKAGEDGQAVDDL